jgi:PAS domain S-box-containing protein
VAEKKQNVLVKELPELDANRFKALIENAYDSVVLYNAEGIIQYASPSIKKFGGFSPLDLVGRKGTDFVYEEDRALAREAFLRALLTPGGSVTEIQRFINKKGQLRWSEYTLTNLLHNPHVRGIVSNFRDIHERKIAEQEANNARKLLKTISENVVDGIFYGIPGAEFEYVNDAFFKITGYKSLEELKEIKPHHLFADVNRWKEINAKLDKKGVVRNEQAIFIRKSGEQFWGSISLSVIRNEKDETRFVGSVQDISLHKKAEEQLQHSQQLLKAISQNINEGLFRSDGKCFHFVNEAFVRLFGYSSIDEILTIKPSQLYANLKDRKAVLQQLKKNPDYTCEILYKRKNGSLFWGQVSYKVISNNKGGYFLDGSIRDITKQKEAEKQLNASRTFLDNVMKTVAAPIFVKDSHHKWVMFNDAFCWFMGRKRQELLGKSEADYFPEESKKSHKVDKQVLRTGDTILSRESIKLKKDKTRYILTVKSRFVNELGERFIIGFITDITEMRERENEINKLNANLQGVMESTQESIYAIDKNYKYLAFNANHARMSKLIYGATISIGSSSVDYIRNTQEAKWLLSELRRAFKGEHFVSEQHINQPRYRDKYIHTTYNPIFDKENKVTGVAIFVRDITEIKKVQQAISHSNATLKGVVESTKDRIFAVDTNFRYLMFNRSHALTMKVLSGHEIKQGDNIIKLLPKDISKKAKHQLEKSFKGKQSSVEFTLLDQHLEASVNPILDSNGKVIGATMFLRDITHRKKTEEKLKLLNEELTAQNWRLAAQEEELKATLEELSERNFELDQLMYKTSHDLRSPLSSVLGLVNLAHIDSDPKNQLEYLDRIEDRIKKLDEFIRSMLNYARVNRTEQTIEQLNIVELINNCIKDLEYLENFSKVTTSIKIKNDHIPFKSDPLLVRIIFSNIISNAYKYYNPAVKSRLSIAVDITPLTVSIEISDNGIGIEKEHVKKVFDMFYRATEKSQGSGLGMYIVKQAVEKLKGTIAVKTKYGKGTTFSIVFPNQ